MYNEAQQKAIDSTDKKILCLAGAGSGKTSVLIGRVVRLVESGVQANRILVLTFTNAAAQEMRARYAKKLPDSAKPVFGTFHSFCYRLIIDDYDVRSAVGYSDIPRVASEAQIKRIKSRCKTSLGIKLSESAINGTPEFLRKQDRFEYDAFNKLYNKTLRKEGLITFAIMCDDVSKLFVEDHPSIRKYKENFQYVFVDEFQDTDKTQWKFVQSFESASLFVVGDARQAIYGFRGADSEIIKRVAENPDWTTIKLEENYRSTEQICAVANKTHDKIWGNSPYNLKLHANKSGEKVQWKNIDLCPEYDAVLKFIEGSGSGQTVAILCRTNREVDSICDMLRKYNIPFKTKNAQDFTPQIIQSAVDDQYLIEFLSCQLPAADFGEFVRMSIIDSSVGTDKDKFLRMFGSKLPELSMKVKNISDILKSDSPASDKFELILAALGRSKPLAAQIETDEDIIKFLTNIELGRNVKGDIYVGTIHSSKGLEYDRVHLVGAGSRSFRLDSEENLNLYYVGITRAKDYLTIWNGDVL